MSFKGITNSSFVEDLLQVEVRGFQNKNNTLDSGKGEPTPSGVAGFISNYDSWAFGHHMLYL